MGKSEIETQKETKRIIGENLKRLHIGSKEQIAKIKEAFNTYFKSYPMFSGKTDEAIDFLALLIQKTEKYILSRPNISSVNYVFQLIKDRSGLERLDLTYFQKWQNGAKNAFSHHIIQIGKDTYEAFGSELSVARMKKAWK